MATEQWVLNGTLLTQDSRRRALKANLRIIGGRIAEITKNTPRSIRNSKVIDAYGHTILPGFVQTHLHLCQTLFRNQADDLELLDWLSKKIWVLEARHTPFTLHVSALVGIHELLSSGTTCILDMATVRHTEAVFEAVLKTGIRANIGKCLMDDPKGVLRESTQKAVTEAVQLYEKWNGRENDRIRASYAPRFALSCTEELLRKVGQLSKTQNAIIHTHASENLKEVKLVRKRMGCENVEYFDRVGLISPRLIIAHGIWLSSHEKKLFKKSKAHIAHCPSSNLKLASGIAQVPELLKAGINISLGADGAACNNHLDMFQEMRLAALIHKPKSGPRAMRAQTVLDMATRRGAQALHWFDDVGSIEVGKKADLIALDLESLSCAVTERQSLDPEALASATVYSAGRNDLRWTMVDGKVLYRNGRVLVLEENHLKSLLKEAQAEVLERLEK